MKLRAAILQGRFCGLETVEECVRNIDMHAMSLFKYEHVEKELTELYKEYNEYEAELLELDWPQIEKEAKADMDEYIAWNEKQAARVRENYEKMELQID
jgi:hypothetical protein